MRQFQFSPDLEQEQERSNSSSQKSSESIPLNMPDNLPERQGRQIRRKIAKKLAPHLGNKAFTRQYVQRQEEDDERPDLIYPPAFSVQLANASSHAKQTRSNGEQVQQAAEEYSAIAGQLVGVKGIKEIPDHLIALGSEIRQGVDAIPKSNKNTNSALEAAKAAFQAAQTK
jgi:hypothetical protein